MGKVTQLTDTWQFRNGLLGGFAAVACILMLAAILGRGARPAIAGVGAAGAALAALQGYGPFRAAHALDGSVLLAIAALGLGGLAIQTVGQIVGQIAGQKPRPLHLLVQAACLIPGGGLLAYAFRDAQPTWVPVVLGLAAPCITIATIDFDQFHRRRGFGPALILVTALGIYVTVPDTEGARVLVGATLPLIALVLPRPAATLGGAGVALLVGIMLSITAAEGAPRPGSIVGAIAGFGFLVVEPIARRVLPELKGRDGHDPQGHLRNTIVAVGLQSIIVAWTCRVAGLSVGATRATLISGVGLVAALFLAPRLPRPPLPERARSPRPR